MIIVCDMNDMSYYFFIFSSNYYFLFHCSVYSAGVGKGSVFTLTLPLCAAPPPTFVLPTTHTQEIDTSSQTIIKEKSIEINSQNSFKNVKDSSNEIKLDEKKEIKQSIKDSEDLKKEKKTLNFLVVDDSHLNRKMLCKLLLSEGHTFNQACDGLEAVERMKENMITENELISFSSSYSVPSFTLFDNIDSFSMIIFSSFLSSLLAFFLASFL